MENVPVAKKKQDRIELRADKEWVQRVEQEAQRWGLTLSAFIRLAVNEKLERDARQSPAVNQGQG